jgi:secondary thiamine-phosphate synthase enzyme
MDSVEIEVRTGGQTTVVDLTSEANRYLDGRENGLLSVFVPHATAGLAIIESGAGSDSDLLRSLDSVLPPDPSLWIHEHGTPGHGRDHVLPAYLAPSLTVPVLGGRMTLGTWQSVVLVDTNVDNPVRRVRFSFIAG